MDLKRLLLIFPVLFLLVYFGAGIFYVPEYVIFIKPFIIPSFMVYAMANNFDKISLKFYFFALFFYIGEILVLVDYNDISIMRFALLSYLFCYISLILLGYENLIKIKKIKCLSGLTLIIFILNIFFLLCILYIILNSIEDFLTIIIIVLNTISAVLLGVFAVLILGESNKKIAFFYFFGSCALIINDVFSALETYYLESVILNTIERLLHFGAFFLFYMFVINDQKTNLKNIK